MMSTRYDKVIKFEGKYLKVNALAPIILAKQLKKGTTILTDGIINKDFGPANFITVENKEQATIFTLSEAMMIQEAFKYHGVDKGEILNIGPKYQSLLRQLGNIKELDIKRKIKTSTTADFDTLERLNEMAKGFSDPQISTVYVDLKKYHVKSITVPTQLRDSLLANAIDQKNSCVHVLSKNKQIPFVVDAIDNKTNMQVQLGTLNNF